MNKKQKACLLVSITVIVVMGLWPPWVIQPKSIFSSSGKFMTYPTEPGPYSWIGNPPVEIDTHRIVRASPHKATTRFIDLYRLGVQYFITAVVTAGLMLILKDRKGSLTDGRKKEINNL